MKTIHADRLEEAVRQTCLVGYPPATSHCRPLIGLLPHRSLIRPSVVEPGHSPSCSSPEPSSLRHRLNHPPRRAMSFPLRKREEISGSLPQISVVFWSCPLSSPSIHPCI